MSVKRVKCTECDAMILPQTAVKFDGMCAHCGSTPEWLREERRAYESALKTGKVFYPSAEELQSAKTPPEFASSGTEWQLDEEYYGGYDYDTVADAVADVEYELKGNVFLISNTNSRLNLSFSEQFAVCEYRNSDTDDFLYAYTKDNHQNQVPEDQHVVQACPCCGVELHWFPSRFHMPRDKGFVMFKNLDAGISSVTVQWLDIGDITRTQKGRG